MTYRPDRQPTWDPVFGDRIQQLVFIGQGLDEETMRKQLDACLVKTDAVPVLDPDSSIENPFPDFELETAGADEEPPE